jgi:hypothetical protein
VTSVLPSISDAAGADFVGGAGEADTALGVRPELLEFTLAAAAGVDLRLHHVKRPRQLARGRDRFIDAHCGMTRRNRHAERGEQLLGLIFVDVHEGPWDKRVAGPKAQTRGDEKRCRSPSPCRGEGGARGEAVGG